LVATGSLVRLAVPHVPGYFSIVDTVAKEQYQKVSFHYEDRPIFPVAQELPLFTYLRFTPNSPCNPALTFFFFHLLAKYDDARQLGAAC